MYTFSEFLTTEFLLEELAPELKSALKDGTYSKSTVNSFDSARKKLEKEGKDTGLEDKISSGSSRKFFAHSGTHQIILDGKPTQIKVGTKFAKRFGLDKYTKSDRLLGQHQNEAEYDASRDYGIFRKHNDGTFSRNPNGVVASAIDHHPEFNHITSVRVEKHTAAGFKEAMKHPDFPKGVSFKQFQGVLMRDHDRMHGKYHSPESYGAKSHEELDKLEEHPIVDDFLQHQRDTGHHPGDIRAANMGLHEDPETGVKRPVLLDAGFDHNSVQLYQSARKNMMQVQRRY
jgi:hypothetical protein